MAFWKMENYRDFKKDQWLPGVGDGVGVVGINYKGAKGILYLDFDGSYTTVYVVKIIDLFTKQDEFCCMSIIPQ